MSGRITPVFNNNNKFTADQIMTEASKLLHTIHKALDLLLELLLLAFHILTCQVETGYRWLVSRPRKDVQGKTVIITGSASGIGRQIAIKFGALGCRVILWDINEEGNNRTAEMVRTKGGEAFPYVCDVRRRDDVSEKAKLIWKDLRSTVDILVNNAGVLVCKNLLQLEEDEIKYTMETNTLAHFWTVKEFLPDMVSKQYGHIVTIASMSALLGVAMVTDYSASKFAVMGFAEALEDEIYRMGLSNDIKTTTACPYMVNTNLLTSISDRVQHKSRFDSPMEPDEVAERIVDGVLRNEELIHVPGKTSSMHIIKALMPKKAVRYITQFADSGYFPVRRKPTQV